MQLLDELVANAAADNHRLAEQMTQRFTLHGDDSFEFGLGCLIDGIAANREQGNGRFGQIVPGTA